MSDAETIMWAVEKDPALRSDFTNITILDRPPDDAALRAKLRQAVEQIPRLAHRVVSPPLRLAPPEWRPDPQFDLDYHLRRIATPEPGGMRELMDVAATAAAAPFDRSRPLWEFTVVEGLEGGQAALLQKVHHTVTDGVGGLKLSMSLLDFERHPAPTAPPKSRVRQVLDDIEAEQRALDGPDAVDRHTPGDVVADAVLYSVRDGIERAIRGLDAAARRMAHPTDARKGAGDALSFARSLRQQIVTDPSRSELLRSRSLGRRFEVVQVGLADAKRAAAALGGSVNDVFVTAVTGALGSYHDRMGSPCDELRMAMPVSLRGGDEDVAGNFFAPARLLVPTRPKEAPARFEAVHERLTGVRDDPGLTATVSLAGLLSPLPTALLVTIARSQARTLDFATSNLRGSPVELYLAGARVEANFPMGPRAGVALNVTLLSYRDSLDLGINLDPAAVTDPAAFLDCLRESFDAVLSVT